MGNRNSHLANASVHTCKTAEQRVLFGLRAVMRSAIVYSLMLYLSCTSVLRANNAFQNLDFEDANLSPIPAGQYGGLVSIADAFPYWTGYLGTNQVTQVLQSNFTLGDASIDIFGPDSSANVILQGQYTAFLQSGVNPFNHDLSSFLDATLTQVGLVPADAKSILLEVSGTNFTVSFAGQAISLSPVGSGPNYTLYEGDISPLAGQEGELRLTSLSTPTVLNNWVLLDAISFSTEEAIPEPDALTLLLVGIVGLVFWHRTHRKRV